MTAQHTHLIGQLESVGYRLDVLGESISTEGREVRQQASELRNLLDTLEQTGREFEHDAAYEAAINKLTASVEVELRHQLELIRDVLSNVRRG